MAKRAIHGVDLQTLDQIFVRGRHGIVQARSMALHRIIERAHGDVDFHWRGSGVGPRGQKAEQGKAKSADQQNQNGDDNPQNEVAHFKSSESPASCESTRVAYHGATVATLRFVSGHRFSDAVSASKSHAPSGAEVQPPISSAPYL